MPKKMKSGRQSQAWKNAEKQAALALKGRRVLRGSDFSQSDVDVIIDDLPELRVDVKFRTRHAHHTFMREIQEKYITEPGQEPVLVTKHHRQESAFATVRLEFLGELLDIARAYAEED